MTVPHSRAPVAPVRPRSVGLHGVSRSDDYHWLRDRDDPAVRAYLEAENAYAAEVLAPLRSLEGCLYDEMLARIKQTDLTVPYRDGPHWYYSRTEEGKQYPIYCRRRNAEDGPEQVLLDLNQLAEGHSHMALGAFEVSPSGRYLAYSIDPTGSRDHRLSVLDLDTGREVLGPVERAGSVAWALDDATFFYTVEDDAKRPCRVHRCRLDGDDAALVFEEPDERFRAYVYTTRSRAWVVLVVATHTTTELQVLDAGRPTGEWRMVARRVEDREIHLDHLDDRFYLVVNDTGPNFRVVTVPIDGVGAAPWDEVLPHREDVIVEHVACFRGHWVAWERRDGLPRVRVTDLVTGSARELDFPETVYEAHPEMNEEFDAIHLRYVYQSFVTPPSVYDADMVSGELTLRKRKDVLGGYDPTRYTTERIHALAADGTAIPISLVRRRDLDPTVPQHLHLTAYGAYGIPYPVSFSSSRVSLLDRGIAIGIAHVRGGGEMGRAWHDAGRLANKTNTFTDFLAVIELLTASERTRPEWLTVEGGSAGGLLIGAVLNLRPDCCRAALLQVPFVDVVNTMLDASLPLTVGEYSEWGNPAVREDFERLVGYCPYSNLAPRPYPALLVRTSLNDSQVMFWEPAKYVARLRALGPGSSPLLLLTNLGAGHAGASGRYDRLREIATDYAFLLWQHGRAQPDPIPDTP